MGNCGRHNNCDNEPTRYLEGDPVKECKCGRSKKDTRCENPISVLSNNVLWNGCELRNVNLKPGDNLEVALQDIDRKLDDLYKKYAKALEVIKELSNRYSDEQ